MFGRPTEAESAHRLCVGVRFPFHEVSFDVTAEFIAKPCDPATLKRALGRALQLPPTREAELVAKFLNMLVAIVAMVVFSALARRLRRERLSLVLTAAFVAIFVLPPLAMAMGAVLHSHAILKPHTAPRPNVRRRRESTC